jgi:hypothetical protein
MAIFPTLIQLVAIIRSVRAFGVTEISFLHIEAEGTFVTLSYRDGGKWRVSLVTEHFQSAFAALRRPDCGSLSVAP